MNEEQYLSKIRQLESEIEYLHGLLDEAGISYKHVASDIDDLSPDQNILYEDDQGARIIPVNITKNHVDYFYYLFKGRSDVYSMRYGNQCAHLELISRFRVKRNKAANLNYYNDVTQFAGLSKSDLNYMDVLRILNKFENIDDIKSVIKKFYFKEVIHGRKLVAEKVLAKMGRKDIKVWKKL